MRWIPIIALLVLFAASVAATQIENEDCTSRLAQVVDAGLTNKLFEPSQLISGSLPEYLGALRALYTHTVEEASMVDGPQLVNVALNHLNCKLPMAEDLAGTGLQVNMTEWSQLAAFMAELYDYMEAKEGASVQRDVVVVGAGPIGLLHALEARALGSRVTVVEKRTSYTRNVWFDLGPEAWFNTLSHLKSMGIARLNLERVRQFTDADQTFEGQVMTVRCRELETTLAKIAFIVGIDFRWGINFCSTDALEAGTERLVALVGSVCNEKDKLEHLPYDLLIGSDGTNSKVRQSVFFAYADHNSFYIDSRIPMRIFGLNQPTLLLNLKPDADGKCPPPKSPNMDSFEPGNSFPGVTHVFSRFYLGHCHLQLLFTQEYAKKHFPLLHRENNNRKNAEQPVLDRENALPWAEILKIANHIFAEPFESVESLKERIVRTKSQGEDGEKESINGVESPLDVQYLQIEIKRTNHVLFRPHLGPNKKPSSLVAIVGDASITAHYRLGIGINNGVRQIDAVTRKALLLPSFSDDSAIEEIDNLELEHLSRLANFEAWLIAAESYCNYVVALDLTKPLFSHSTYLRDTNREKDGLILLKGLDILTSCEALGG